jgi:hypothetical protein
MSSRTREKQLRTKLGHAMTNTTWGPAGQRTSSVSLAAAEYLRLPVRLTNQEKTAAVTRVRWLEHQLFDADGQVRRRVRREQAQAIVDELNQLRATLGWLEVDLAGRWRWP